MKSQPRALHRDLIEATCRILRLNGDDVRVTDETVICKNPNYSLCDVILLPDVMYALEYAMSYWASRAGCAPVFVFKNSGCGVSLCCYVRVPLKPVRSLRVGEYNALRVNECLAVTLEDLERLKPSTNGVLTNCVVRRGGGGVYHVELIAFGPASEVEYEELVREIHRRMPWLGGGAAATAVTAATAATAAAAATPTPAYSDDEAGEGRRARRSAGTRARSPARRRGSVPVAAPEWWRRRYRASLRQAWRWAAAVEARRRESLWARAKVAAGGVWEAWRGLGVGLWLILGLGLFALAICLGTWGGGGGGGEASGRRP